MLPLEPLAPYLLIRPKHIKSHREAITIRPISLSLGRVQFATVHSLKELEHRAIFVGHQSVGDMDAVIGIDAQ